MGNRFWFDYGSFSHNGAEKKEAAFLSGSFWIHFCFCVGENNYGSLAVHGDGPFYFLLERLNNNRFGSPLNEWGETLEED